MLVPETVRAPVVVPLNVQAWAAVPESTRFSAAANAGRVSRVAAMNFFNEVFLVVRLFTDEQCDILHTYCDALIASQLDKK